MNIIESNEEIREWFKVKIDQYMVKYPQQLEFNIA